MPPKVEFEQIDEHGSMVHSVISCSLRFHGKGCCDPSTIGDYTLSFNRLYFLSCTVASRTKPASILGSSFFGIVHVQMSVRQIIAMADSNCLPTQRLPGWALKEVSSPSQAAQPPQTAW